MTTLDAAGLVGLQDQVATIRVGDVSVVDVEATDEWDADGEPYIRLLIYLSDPQGETWGPENFDEIGRRVDLIVGSLPGHPAVRTLFTGGDPKTADGAPPAEDLDEP